MVIAKHVVQLRRIAHQKQVEAERLRREEEERLRRKMKESEAKKEAERLHQERLAQIEREKFEEVERVKQETAAKKAEIERKEAEAEQMRSMPVDDSKIVEEMFGFLPEGGQAPADLEGGSGTSLTVCSCSVYIQPSVVWVPFYSL